MTSINKSYVTVCILVAVLGLWMASGLFVRDTESNSPTPEAALAKKNSGQLQKDQSDLMKVEVMAIELAEVTRDLTLQGQLQPKRHLQIRSETTGIVESLPVEKGTRVADNTLLVKLSLDGRDARLTEAKARIQSALSEQNAAQKLRKQGLQSQLKLELAQAALASAQAELARSQLEIDNTVIKSPFGGILNALPVELGQQLERGTVVAEIVDDNSFIVTASVAQQTIQHLAVGQAVTAKLITGIELRGKINYISAIADAETRSFNIEAEVANPSSAIAAGVSTSLIIPVERLEATFLSPSSIALGPDGEIGVKTVNADDTVEFHVVSLIRTTSEGAWVTGVPPGSRIITLGQGFVNAGQKVSPVNAEVNTQISDRSAS